MRRKQSEPQGTRLMLQHRGATDDQTMILFFDLHLLYVTCQADAHFARMSMAWLMIVCAFVTERVCWACAALRTLRSSSVFAVSDVFGEEIARSVLTHRGLKNLRDVDSKRSRTSLTLLLVSQGSQGRVLRCVGASCFCPVFNTQKCFGAPMMLSSASLR